METPDDRYDETEEEKRREEEDAPVKIYRKYGRDIMNFISGDRNQPIWSYTFRLTYEQTDGLLRHAWQNEMDNPFINDLKTFMNPNYTGRIYGGYTLLQLELPRQKTKLKIYSKGTLHFLSALNPNKVLTGATEFDNNFVVIARPKSIIKNIYRELDFLMDNDFGRSLSLITDYEDAITLRFYLQIRINKLLTEEKDIEKLLKHTLVLVKKLNSLG
ncbi:MULTISPECIES: hypothetical protein [unclassified Chitinophaga]|uniref:hypothetical protein n=1 Tax=unclassified Chitinophaga TaxID=2619133 RepID=UPI00300FE99E